MSLRKISGRTLLFSVVLLCFLPLLPAEAQDVDVPGNLTMRDSTGPTVGNILKGGGSLPSQFRHRQYVHRQERGQLHDQRLQQHRPWG